MTIFRAERAAKGWTPLNNSIFDNESLSFKAKGLLGYLLSRPENWRPNSNHLATIGPDGREAVRTGLQELQRAGYLVRSKVMDQETGLWTTMTVVYEEPLRMVPEIDEHGYQKTPTRRVRRNSPSNTGVGLPEPGSPDSGKPHSSTSNEQQEVKEIAVLRTGRATSGRRRVDPRAEEDASTLGDYSNVFELPSADPATPADERRATNVQYAAGMARRFAELATADSGLVQHTNQAALRKSIRGWLDQGVTREVVRSMIDKFFAGKDFDTDKPLWKHFLAVAPQLQHQESAKRTSVRRAASRTGQVHRPVASLKVHD